MTTYYVDPENGDDANNGTAEATPWRLIPGQSGANAVSAGDIINIKNGTTSTGGNITPAADNLTYRGYGVASNVLRLRLPGNSPAELTYLKVVRSAGTHEGMWKLDMRNVATTVGVTIADARSGIIIEDLHVYSDSTSSSLIRVGTSSATSSNTGFTLRRSHIEGAGIAGMTINKFNPTIEYVKVNNCLSDCIRCSATTTNSDRAGSTDVFRYLDLSYPNTNYQGVPDPSGGGDILQTIPNTSTGKYEAKLRISDVAMRKGVGAPAADAKQSLLVHDGLNGIVVNRIHIYGEPGAQIGILLGSIRGKVILQNIYFSGYNKNLQAIRIQPGSNPIGTQLLATGATLTLRNIVNNAVTTGAFFSCAESSALEMDGTLNIENCTLNGSYEAGYSYDAEISLQGGSTTYGTNFKVNIKNNIFNNVWTKIKLPTGTANDADYVVTKNWFKPGTGNSFYIGSTEYTTLATFEAAHSGATGNINGNLDINLSNLMPTSTASAQVGTGSHITYCNDIQGVARYNPPCIGAYELIR